MKAVAYHLFIALALSGFTSSLAGAQTNATLQIHAGDFMSVAQPFRPFSLFPVPNQVPATNNLGLVTGDFVSGQTDVGGNATLTNVLAGIYRMEFKGTTLITTNYLLIPTTTNTINARDWVTLYPTGLGFLLFEEAGVVGGRIVLEP